MAYIRNSNNMSMFSVTDGRSVLFLPALVPEDLAAWPKLFLMVYNPGLKNTNTGSVIFLIEESAL